MTVDRLASAILEGSPNGILVVDPAGRVVFYNPRFLDIWAVPADLIAARRDAPILAWVTGQVADADAFAARVADLYSRPDAVSQDKVVLKDGHTLDRYTAPVTTPDGVRHGRVWYFRDITESERAERTLTRLNRTLRALSTAHEALVHAHSEDQLRNDMCRVIVEVGGYRLAWIGVPMDDAQRKVIPLAWAGPEAAYVVETELRWSDSDLGRGPTGTAVRTGRIQVNRDFEGDPALAPWREAAARHGFKSSIALPLTDKSSVVGSLTIYAAEAGAFDGEEVKLLSELADALSFGAAALRDRIGFEAADERLRQSLIAAVAALASAAEMRDPYTAGHQRRVAALGTAIARRMGLSEDRIQGVFLGCVIHDVGKIRISLEILAKVAPLTPAELALLRTHAQAGFDTVKGIDFPWPIAEMILQHHERLDGSGYPNGLRGEAILLETRILSVADVVEAMRSARPYRAAVGLDRALAEVEHGVGRLYDAAVVAACVALFRQEGFSFDDLGPPRGTAVSPQR